MVMSLNTLGFLLSAVDDVSLVTALLILFSLTTDTGGEAGMEMTRAESKMKQFDEFVSLSCLLNTVIIRTILKIVSFTMQQHLPHLFIVKDSVDN